MSLIQKGIESGLITISEDNKTIKYLHQNKSRNYTNPEEKVQAEAFLQLVLDYGYPVENIQQFVSVTMGSEKKEADLVVYEDTTFQKPKIIVECKKQEVSQQEFNQAINQAFSYANALSGTLKYIWVYSELLNEKYRFNKEKNTREELTDLPKYGSDVVAPYQFVKGGGTRKFKDEEGNDQTQKFRDIKTVSEEDLTRRFKQAHDSLWAGGQLNPSEAFDELDKLIFCKIWDEKYNFSEGEKKHRKKGEVYDFQVITYKGKDDNETTRLTNEALSKRVKKIYEFGKKFDKEVFKDNIRLSDERIRTIVNYLQEINLGDTDLDSKGRAFETFMGSFFRGEFGQFFTPRPIVQFIVEALPIKNTSLVLDTSCGSGGFLLHALDKVRKQANEEFPEYQDDVKEYQAWHEYWHDFAEKNLYGIEINEQIARTAKMNMIIHDDGHTNVISIDGLVDQQNVFKSTENKGFKFNRFNFIITNPPFGSSIKRSEKSYLNDFYLGKKQPDWLDYKGKKEEARNSQSTEVLFIEQCYNYLAENGFLAVVIPDGILTSSSLQYVRDSIEDWYRIIAVVSMPQSAFSATGAGVKSSVMFLKKHPQKHTEKLQNLKTTIQNSIKVEFKYFATIEKWEKDKKKIIDNMTGFKKPEGKTDKQIKATQEFKDWKAEISQEYADKLTELQEEMTIRYDEERSKNLPDYPIFMAIAENIGYDAAGKSSTLIKEKKKEVKESIKTITEIHSHDLYDERIVKIYDIHNEKEELATRKEIIPAGILVELQKFINKLEK